MLIFGLTIPVFCVCIYIVLKVFGKMAGWAIDKGFEKHDAIKNFKDIPHDSGRITAPVNNGQHFIPKTQTKDQLSHEAVYLVWWMDNTHQLIVIPDNKHEQFTREWRHKILSINQTLRQQGQTYDYYS